MMLTDNRTCLQCGDVMHPPYWMADNPRFCCQSCAAAWALDMTDRRTWDPDADTWFQRPARPDEFIV